MSGMSDSGDSAGGTTRGIQRLQEAFDEVKKFSFVQLDSIIPGDFQEQRIKSELTKIIVELNGIGNFDEFKNMCDITKTSPKYLMSLFVCGFIQSDSMSLEEWNRKKTAKKIKDQKKFTKFQQKFIEYLANPTEIKYVKNYDIQQTAWDKFEQHKGKALPADLCIIRDTEMSTKDCVLDIWRDSTDYTDYNIEVWPLFFVLSLQLRKKMGCFGVTSATGASYIFLCNLPSWDDSQSTYGSRKDSYWKKYIEDPITLYSSTIEQLAVTQTQIVSNISTSNKEDCVFLYVHLFTLLTFPNYENNHFYSRFHTKTFEFTKSVFRMSGMTYKDIQAVSSLNTMDTDQDYPFNVLPDMTSIEKGLGRLASKYIDLLTEELVYTEPVHKFEFFHTNPYQIHQDLLVRDKHCVMYDWVFRNPNLLYDSTWQNDIPTASNGDWQKIDTCRRVYHALWLNLNGKPGRESAIPFFMTLQKGEKIEDGEIGFKEGIVEVDLEGAYKEQGINPPNVQEFVQSQSPEIQTAIGSYFGARPYTVSDLAYKYVARLKSDNSLIVVDSHDWFKRPGGGSTSSIKSVPLQPLPPTEEPKFGMLRPAVASGAQAATGATSNSDSEESGSEDSVVPDRPGTALSSRGGANKYDLTSLIHNLERVTKRHALEIVTRKERLKGLTALTQDQKNEHEKETKELEKLNRELLQIKEEMKTMQEELQGLEAVITEKDDLIEEKDKKIAEKEEKITELEQKLKDLEENMRLTGTEAQDKIKDLEDKIAGLENDINEKNNITGNLETEKVDLETQITALKDQIAGLENDIKEKDDTTGKLETEKVDLETQITALKDENKALENEKNQIKLSKDGDTQQNAQAVAALEREKDKLEQEVQNLTTISNIEKTRNVELEGDLEHKEEELSELRNETEAAEKALLNATKNMDKDMSEELKEYDTVMSEGMKLVVTDNMREKLRKGEFREFYDLVKMHPSKKETYSNAALFLVMESMGGTWKMAQDSRVRKGDTENYDEIITEKIIYDLRQWDSIGNHMVDMKHTSKDFKAFVEAFGLSDDVGGGNVYRPAPPPRTRTGASYKKPTQPADAADAGVPGE
jgi:predicted  nucleic acid-binding Zn-ribbon protein